MSKMTALTCSSIVFCLLFLAVISAEPPPPTRFSYNSSDLSYLSNGIQWPAPEPEMLTSLDEMTGPEVTWFTRLFDHHKWRRSGPFLAAVNNDSKQCQDDLTVYLEALENGTHWAAKMYDSSGHYSSQFFFGNDYWLGSNQLCQELTDRKLNSHVPPFDVHFYVAKVRVNINPTLTPVTRQLNVGQCLPSACSLDDVTRLLSSDRRVGSSLNVVNVRRVPGDYKVLDDVKVQIIGGALLSASAIILVASLVDLIRSRKMKDVKQKKEVDAENTNNNNNNNNGHNKDSDERKKANEGIPMRILLCFSAVANGKKILDIEAPSDNNSIRCIHGLRFFSILWIILVHTYLEVFSISDNKGLRLVKERTFLYQTIANATFSVDTFFFISGLLVTFTYFRMAARSTKKPSTSTCRVFGSCSLKFLMLMIYRFFRLTPAYLLVLGINEIIMRYLHSNSVFAPAIIDHISCSNYWWRNALYINNFFPQQEFCMLWSWYIANDTQFYLIAVLLLLVAVRGEKQLIFAGLTLALFLLSSWIITFVIALKYNYTIRVEEPFALFDQLYDKPWMRIGPYLVGMAAGYFLFRTDSKLVMPMWAVGIGWPLSLLCLASLVYGVGTKGLFVPLSAFYAALGHTAWGLSLAWITIACATGYGGPVNAFFKYKLFLPLSRLTYCAYLVHPMLMCFCSFLLDGPLHLQQFLVIVIYFGNIVVSFLCAFFISLVIEAPAVNLLKIIF